MPVSVRLDPEDEAWIRQEARARGVTRSDIVRDALRVAKHATHAQAGSRPYEAFADVIGCARGGAADLSVRSGEKLAALLRARTR